MPVGKAIIDIKNLRLRTFIGFNPEEREKQQDIIVNAVMHYDASDAMATDNVDQAVNYKSITKSIIHHVENNRFLLLEKLVCDLLSICSEPIAIDYASVTVDKPHALRFADSVSLTIDYHRND
ncbi:MAG: dihydroneopterin triphosphate 2'-epimerase [Candidatus Pelagadaptatus aseana]|uniref:dihydroneopterin triphosphate 2'-epimerase n=1 Tax=Candidatus Pelagadaptatus aseana TaxID=3120508 RepID=UPI0039B143AA